MGTGPLILAFCNCLGFSKTLLKQKADDGTTIVDTIIYPICLNVRNELICTKDSCHNEDVHRPLTVGGRVGRVMHATRPMLLAKQINLF